MTRFIILGASGQVGTALTAYARAQFPEADILCTRREPGEGYLSFDPLKDDWSLLGTCDVLINAIGIIQEQKGASFEDIHIRLVQILLEKPRAIGASAHCADLGPGS